MKLLFVWCSCPPLRNRSNHLNWSWVIFQSSPGGTRWHYYSLTGVSVLGCVTKSSLAPFVFGGWRVTLEGELFFSPEVLSR